MTLSMDDSAKMGTGTRLFEPGERLGWDWLDRKALIKPFSELEPEDPEVPPDVLRRYQTAQKVAKDAEGAIAGIGCFAILALLVVIIVVITEYPYVLLLLPVGGYFVYSYRGYFSSYWSRFSPQAAYKRAAAEASAQGKAARAGWSCRKAEFERSEQQRVLALPQWWGARTCPGTRKIQVVGGNLFSWEAFITVFGGSMVAERPPVMIIDLSEEMVSAKLTKLTRSIGASVDEQLLPAELHTCHLLASLDAQQLLDVLIDGMHHNADTTDRTARVVDMHILTTVSQALGSSVTVGRLAEAMVALMGQPAAPTLLTSQEWDHITTNLFSAAYLQQSYERLRHLHAYLNLLAEIGTQPRSQADNPRLIVISLESGQPSGRIEVLTDLITQWLLRAVANQKSRPAVLVIVSADKIARVDLERLSDICDRQGVRLVYLFRHLRETTLNLIGGSATCIMQLGNHEEAARAADFIGREHTFKLHQLTKTTGENRTRTEGYSYTETATEGPGWFQKSHSQARGLSASDAQGTNWSETFGAQRVYDYRVEPSVIQTLPDHAMLLIEAGPNGPLFRAIDVNPDFAGRPDATTRALAQPYAGVP